eukprot:TRINITY_DN78910_c0_g1_i1.p1 TRINITY_DN78910_c0_g1~~TRINITY_DN78910_c0_g1_i1.p1  ORF type:complete len:164 (+),score=29.95 TRINITY_DN78910_c0_g1_i1:61-552(+)
MPKPRVAKVLKAAKGFYGRGKSCFRVAKQRVMKAMQYQYISRKHKKRDAKKMWIQKINAACRQHGLQYSKFTHGLSQLNILINKKVLANLAVNEPVSFHGLVHTVLTKFPEMRHHQTHSPQIKSLQVGLIASTLGRSGSVSFGSNRQQLPIIQLGKMYGSIQE